MTAAYGSDGQGGAAGLVHASAAMTLDVYAGLFGDRLTWPDTKPDLSIDSPTYGRLAALRS